MKFLGLLYHKTVECKLSENGEYFELKGFFKTIQVPKSNISKFQARKKKYDEQTIHCKIKFIDKIDFGNSVYISIKRKIYQNDKAIFTVDYLNGLI